MKEVHSGELIGLNGAAEYPITNDAFLWNNHQPLGQFRDAVNDNNGEKRATVVVGSGGVLSLADVYAPNVFVTDCEPKLLAWVHKSREALLHAQDAEQFLELPEMNMHLEESQTVGRLHFLSSRERFQHLQQAVGQASFRYVQLDYGVQSDVEDFAELLISEGIIVDTFNATNLHTHIRNRFRQTGHEDRIHAFDEYIASLGLLPWAAEYRILASDFRYGHSTFSLPPMDSIEAYARETGFRNRHNQHEAYFRQRVVL